MFISLSIIETKTEEMKSDKKCLPHSVLLKLKLRRQGQEVFASLSNIETKTEETWRVTRSVCLTRY